MTKSKFPLVSIVITTRNEEKNISRVIESVQYQTYPHREIIVVDNHSTDQTVWLAKSATSLVFTKGNERSAQRNFGALKAHGKLILFLDADMELTPDVIKDCVTSIQTYKNVAVIIPEDSRGKSFFARVKRIEKRLYWNESAIEAPRFFVKNVFWRSGGYNEKLVAGEDWDIKERIQKIGSIGRAASVLFHHESSLIRELAHKYYYAKHIHYYQSLHPHAMNQQSGIFRVSLYLRKRSELLKDPLPGIALLLLKTFEYGLYLIGKTIA